MLAAVLGRQQAGEDAAAGQRRRGLGAAARNAAVVAEAYPESEAHAGMGAGGKYSSKRTWYLCAAAGDTLQQTPPAVPHRACALGASTCSSNSCGCVCNMGSKQLDGLSACLQCCGERWCS
jgi:hypothetical protein